MISFKKREDKIIAIYSTRSENIDWLYEKFQDDDSYSFQKTFTFSKEDLVDELPDKDDEFNPFHKPEPIDFFFASLVGEYYLVKKGVLTNKFEVYISAEIDITIGLFVAERDISIYKKIEDIISEDIYIGGSHPTAIPENIFIELINQFPNGYEKKLYADAKISSLIKEFFSSTKDIEKGSRNT